MKDDDSSSIVRSQTAHHVNVSEYTGNATTPQNHVTSDVDRELVISEADAGPARQIVTDHEPVGDDASVAAPNTQALDATPTDASESVRIEADAATPPSDPIDVPVDAFQDELAAIERARDIDHRQRVPTEPTISDHAVGLAGPSHEPAPFAAPEGLADDADLHHETAHRDETHAPATPQTEHQTLGPDLTEAAPGEHAVALPTPVEAAHLEAVATEPPPPEHSASEAKPVFSDSHALLPEQGQALHDPELDLAELGHAHPLIDHEPDPGASHLNAAHAHLHTPPHALSPTQAALADLNKDEFQGRLAGIKREVQALNDRLTDFEAELDKDGMRPARP